MRSKVSTSAHSYARKLVIVRNIFLLLVIISYNMGKINNNCVNLNAFEVLPGLFPDSYQNDVHVCNVNTEQKIFLIRMKLGNMEEFNNFLEQWSHETHVTWRVNKSDPRNMSAGNKNVFWSQYRCQSSNTRVVNSTENSSKKHTNCQAAFTVTIKKINKRCRSQDKHLPQYPTIIKGCFKHNHGLFCADNLKHKDVSKGIQLKFTTLFENGDNPVSALDKHKFYLQAKYKDNYFVKAADRSLCPDLQWCYRLYKSIKDKEYEIQDNFEEQLNSRFDKNCFKLSQALGNTIVAICTPLMKRVHRLWPYSSELVFLDSSGNFDCQQHRVFVVLTHSYAGGLPLGIIITTSESEAVISEGLKCLISLIGNDGFSGRGYLGPQVIITDDCKAEQNAIQNIFPQTVSLLCTFHILQAAWRNIWKAENKVKSSDRFEVFSHVKKILYAENEIDLEEKYKFAVSSNLLMTYPNILKYLEELWQKRHLWALCFRKDLKIRGNNTNNYVESAMRILKDKIFHRKKAYNIIHLMDFIFQNLEDYFVSKLTDVAINKNDCHIQKRHLHSSQEGLSVMVTEDETIFHVQNMVKGTSYTVDVQLGVCSCYVGYNGAPCKHQSVVIQQFNIESYNFLPANDSRQRILIHKIAHGQEAEIPDQFYESLTNDSYFNDVIINTCQPSEGLKNLRLIPSQVEEGENEEKNSEQCENVINMFRSCTKYIEGKVHTEPDFLTAVGAFNQAFKRCKTNAALLHALHNFGRTVGRKAHKNINVQSTSKARRKRALSGCGRVRSGRPSKKSRVEHLYYKTNNKRQKAPHSIAECTSRNVPLGK